MTKDNVVTMSRTRQPGHTIHMMPRWRAEFFKNDTAELVHHHFTHLGAERVAVIAPNEYLLMSQHDFAVMKAERFDQLFRISPTEANICRSKMISQVTCFSGDYRMNQEAVSVEFLAERYMRCTSDGTPLTTFSDPEDSYMTPEIEALIAADCDDADAHLMSIVATSRKYDNLYDEEIDMIDAHLISRRAAKMASVRV